MTEPLALVTGATGMVGAAIVRALLGRRCRVRVLARDPERARSLWGSAVEVLAGDLRAPASLVRACQGVSDLYHAAALVGDGPETALRETNVEGTRHLLRAARASGVARIAFTSSVSVYGDGLRPGVAEDAPLAPQSAYGLSKVEAEEAVREIARDGVHAVILRPCIVYGPGDRYFTPQLLSAVRFPVLPLPDGGGHLVDLVHADDVAAAHILALERGVSGQAYNVTDGRRHTVREIIGWGAEAAGRSPWCPALSRRTARFVLPGFRLLGRLLKIPELARLRDQDLAVFFGDYHFDISRIVRLGFAPRVLAPDGVPACLRAWRPARP